MQYVLYAVYMVIRIFQRSRNLVLCYSDFCFCELNAGYSDLYNDFINLTLRRNNQNNAKASSENAEKSKYFIASR